ncbi:MAG: hypothetical protein M3247_08715, partial [Thermoproteota archaeon]|nr:hypothetical protein [Thermoproteota archaeon]
DIIIGRFRLNLDVLNVKVGGSGSDVYPKLIDVVKGLFPAVRIEVAGSELGIVIKLNEVERVGLVVVVAVGDLNLLGLVVLSLISDE